MLVSFVQNDLPPRILNHALDAAACKRIFDSVSNAELGPATALRPHHRPRLPRIARRVAANLLQIKLALADGDWRVLCMLRGPAVPGDEEHANDTPCLAFISGYDEEDGTFSVDTDWQGKGAAPGRYDLSYDFVAARVTACFLMPEDDDDDSDGSTDSDDTDRD